MADRRHGLRTDDEELQPLDAVAHPHLHSINTFSATAVRDFWYDQPQHEWVVLLAGVAAVRFESEEPAVERRPGDFLTIPAHRRHRVEWTTPDGPTVWIAVHYGD